MGLPFYHPKAKAKGERYKKVIPEVKANPISRITFSWMFPLLKVSLCQLVGDGGRWWKMVEDGGGAEVERVWVGSRVECGGR